MVTVKVTETYDLKTTKDKLGIIGIHTPKYDLVQRLYPGLVKQHKFMRFRKCDVVGACASVLPADPLQVGVTSGTVAPEDMFNPMLYKAVSNDSFDTLISRIYDTVNTSDVSEHGSVNSQNLDISADDAFKIYYSLLSEPRTWRKSMPQTGFAIRGLVPIAHTLLSQYGNVKIPHTGTFEDVLESVKSVPDSLGDVPFISPDMTTMSDSSSVNSNGLVFKGRSVRMPKFPIHYAPETINGAPVDPKIPKTFVAALIVPPARLHEFYYRMRVTWTIDFIGLCSTLQYGGLYQFTGIGDESHGQNYAFASAKTELPNESSTVDTDNVDVNKIMES